MVETKFGSSSEELERIFGMDQEKREKIAGIRGRLKMPNPEIPGDRVNARILFYQNSDGTTELYKNLTGEQFTGEAIFLNCEEVEQPGIEKDLALSKSLYQAIDREVHNNGMAWEDLPSNVIAITADYWTSAPVNRRGNTCPRCKGDGCAFCRVTGNGEDSGKETGLAPPTVYNAQLIGKNMPAGKSQKGVIGEF